MSHIDGLMAHLIRRIFVYRYYHAVAFIVPAIPLNVVRDSFWDARKININAK